MPNPGQPPKPCANQRISMPGATGRVIHESQPVPRLEKRVEAPQKPRLLDRVRQAIRARHYSPLTEKAYVAWITRLIFFYNMRHPDQMGEPEISAYVSYLAMQKKVSASTQNQALCALVFLYRHVLRRELDFMEIARAKRPLRLPVVLSRKEAAAVLERLQGVSWLMASLMYGAGFRVLECCRVRVKDVDLERPELTVRNGKGERDPVTMLPRKLVNPLKAHLRRVRRLHTADLKAGAGFVALPYALRRKYTRAAREWSWQWLFPASRIYRDRETDERRRHFRHQTAIQRAVRQAVREVGIAKPATCHSLAIPSRLTFSKTATTSERSRSCWATKT